MGPDQLMGMMQGTQVSAVIKAGIELGLFDALGAGHDTVERIAPAIAGDPRGTRILLDALAALGLVTRTPGARYGLTEVAGAHLVKGRPGDMSDAARLFTSDHLWDSWKTLAQAVRAGGSVLDEHAGTPDHPFWHDFARWTGSMAGFAGQQLAAVLEPWASARLPLEVLDVACGTGLFGFSLAAAQPQARVTSQDWPGVLEVTRTWATKAGVADRVRYLPGDCFTAELGGPYDLAILSHIFHHFDRDTCARLLGRVARALKPDGRVAIHEFVTTSAPPTEDPGPYMFSTTMLMWTRAGEAHDLARYEGLLADAGFAPPEVHPSLGLPTKFLVSERRR